LNSTKFPYNWDLKDSKTTKDKGKVFSCFSCGGGSTMGYKLAEFDVIGCNEIDPKMMAVYKINHRPKYSYLEDIRTFKLRKDLPKALYNLDILDGSPPCSSFSMAGNREKDWGKEKKFKEGQVKQRLDTLFFDFIDLAKELQPKIVVAENVKGILLGKAASYKINYVNAIYKAFDKAGYYCQHYLLDASKMGVPQKRERVFFICLRKDLAKPFLKKIGFFKITHNLKLEFNEPEITFSEIDEGILGKRKEINSEYALKVLQNVTSSGVCQNFKKSLGGKLGGISFVQQVKNKRVALTVNANSRIAYLDGKHEISKNEICKVGSFPLDYNFLKQQPRFIIGMSVPPVMLANIAEQIYLQLLSKLK